MTDPIAEAAAAQAAAQNQPSSTEAVPNGAGGASLDTTSSLAGSAPVASPSGVGEQGNVISAAPSATDGSATATSSAAESSTQTTTATTDTVAPSGDAGNAPAATPAASSDALVAIAEPHPAAPAIQSRLDAIRKHLSLRGFEEALVQDIHHEIEAIEGML